tara:strand:- start:63 stop:905 length:843 start_codon:yes stop_codon:yes gene_type:complete
MNQIICSTFNERLYEIYAHELIQTWHETSQLLDMHIFCEDGFIGPQVENQAGAKLHWHNLFDLEPDCKAFVERNRHRDSKGKFYLDGVRFSYKVFAQNAARKFGDRVFYIDADTKFCKQIKLEHYDRILPKDKFIAFYDRPPTYTESGFIAFDNTKSIADKFYKLYLDWYKTDKLYEGFKGILNNFGFTDCHAFDGARKVLNLDKEQQILGDGKKMHIMARDPLLNTHIDHRKGNRKLRPHSFEYYKVRYNIESDKAEAAGKTHFKFRGQTHPVGRIKVN